MKTKFYVIGSSNGSVGNLYIIGHGHETKEEALEDAKDLLAQGHGQPGSPRKFTIVQTVAEVRLPTPPLEVVELS